MAYQITELCLPEEREDEMSWFAFDPAKVYPATVARIKQVIDEELLPGDITELLGSTHPEVSIDEAAKTYLRKAKQLPPEAFELALTPREDVTSAKDIEMRALTLELARLWFTRALKAHTKEPVGVHILNDPDFRL